MPDLPQKKTLSVLPAGDVELWTVSGKTVDDFEWRLPLRAYPYDNQDHGRFYFVRRGMMLRGSQYDAICRVLNAWNNTPDEPKGWWFKEATFLKFAVKAPGITPDYYVRWPGVEPPKIDPEEKPQEEVPIESDPELSSAEATFLKKVHFRVGDISWEALKVIWRTIRGEAGRRLARDFKPLDLGFVKIIPVPYRINWREALFVRFADMTACFKNRREQKSKLVDAGVIEALSSVKMLAIDPQKKIIRWTFELVPSKDLERSAEEQEFSKRMKFGKPTYANHVLKSMSNALENVIEVLRHYSDSVTVPTAMRKEGDRFGSVVLEAAHRADRVRPGRGICEGLTLNPETGFTCFSDESAPKPAPIEIPEFLQDVDGFRKMIADGKAVVEKPGRRDRYISLTPNQGSTLEDSPSTSTARQRPELTMGRNSHSRHVEIDLDQSPEEPQDGIAAGTDCKPDNAGTSSSVSANGNGSAENAEGQ